MLSLRRLLLHSSAALVAVGFISPPVEAMPEDPPGAASPDAAADLFDRVDHHYAKNGDVKLHYVSIGSGPVVILLHGFPDFWYTWRHQMDALAADHRVVAMDLRGYNKSDKPKGVEQYDMKLLIADVEAVLVHAGAERATIVGHDWGGAIAWGFAMARPKRTERLIILNLPHPRGLLRELATNPQQQKNSAYAREFQKEGAHEKLSAEGLALWVKEASARPRYVEAFKRSDFAAMLSYYKQNYPREPYESNPLAAPGVKVKCPVLMFHGLDDWALLPGALSGTWDWIESDLTLVTVPGAGHWVQYDAKELVTRRMRTWLRDTKQQSAKTPSGRPRTNDDRNESRDQ